jgi:hypothetical protein
MWAHLLYPVQSAWWPIHAKRFLFRLMVICFLATNAQAQNDDYQASKGGFGLRFGVDFNRFLDGSINPLIDGYFSSAVIGPFYKSYYAFGCLETGINLNYKGRDNQFTLPFVNENFRSGENNSLQGIEAVFIVGPRIGYFYPKFGLIGGIWQRQQGWNDAGKRIELSGWYMNLPVGLSLDLPTSFGSTGLGLYYKIGLTNIYRELDMNYRPVGNWDGKLRSIYAELHVMFWTKGKD